MTKEQIIKEFKIDDFTGLITSPGKFEGEMIYAPYFYDLALDGHQDDVRFDGDVQVDIFNISKTDTDHFNELSSDLGNTLELWQDDMGFVNIHIND